ncbi:MAG: class I SAM-dependent methyltransferase [Myxococcales bacterium]|nr:class I SAM-dependent methyltransferase [Myxococcales bacterium]
MSNHTPYEWDGARGERWRQHVDPLEAMLATVNAPLIDALQLGGAARIADIGCGGGGATRAIHAAAPSGSTVVGLDLSHTLVQAAQQRAGADGPRFRQADAGTAPPPSEPYDRLASRFGVMFFDDAPTAFANLRQWLAAGGQVAFAVWADRADNPWATTVMAAVAEVMELPQPEPDAPGPFRYGDPAALPALLRQAGFADVACRSWRGQLAVGGGLTAEEAAQFTLSAFGVGEMLQKQGSDHEIQQATRSLTERFRPHVVDGVVRMDAHAHLVTATRP